MFLAELTKDIYGLREGQSSQPVASDLKADPTYLKGAQKVFGNSYFDYGRNHDGILDTDVKDIAQRSGIAPDAPVVLINFDTHPDLARGEEKGWESISDWVSTALIRNPQITDFYWAMPNDLGKGELAKEFLSGKGKEVKKNLLPPDFDIYIRDGKITWDKKDLDYSGAPKEYRVVHVHRSTIDNMPSMTGKNVMLTTDLDAFDNRGFDTPYDAQVRWQGEPGFNHYVQILDQKGIHPFFHFVPAAT
jgi:hypothetical protein